MAIKKTNKEETKKAPQVEYKPAEISIAKVKPVKGKEDCYRFNLTINGVTIYGCSYVTYTNKDGKEDNFIAFPSYKGSDGEHYNTCFFPINNPAYRKEYELVEELIGQAVEA